MKKVDKIVYQLSDETVEWCRRILENFKIVGYTESCGFEGKSHLCQAMFPELISTYSICRCDCPCRGVRDGKITKLQLIRRVNKMLRTKCIVDKRGRK